MNDCDSLGSVNDALSLVLRWPSHHASSIPCLQPSFSLSSSVHSSPNMDPGQQTSLLPEPSAEYFSWDYRLHLIGLGFAFYAAAFLLSHLVSVALFATYNSLLAKEKVFWNLAATRALFGIQSTVAGLRALTEESVITADKVKGQRDWSWFNILTATGFFVFENVALHASNMVFRSFDIPLATHHFFALSGYLGAVVWDSLGHFLPMVTLLLEMSTPFTCISWMLLKVGAVFRIYVSVKLPAFTLLLHMTSSSHFYRVEKFPNSCLSFASSTVCLSALCLHHQNMYRCQVLVPLSPVLIVTW